MAHTIGPHDARILRVDYFGDVDYRERCETVTAAALVMSRDGFTRLLVDFTRATVLEEHDGSRADFIANVITAPWPDHTRIAPLNASRFAMQGSRLAGTSRGLLVQGFDSEEHAVAWLLATE